ncbi:uncharacterized protein [Mytilus edulis]|uniref:uncharacterized protein n=1 Tax=Mytilus edulis TaxID=6550 RepID=UPI0039EFCC65
MSRYVAVLFFVIFAVVTAYDPVYNYYPGGGGHPHDGGTGGDPHHTVTGGDSHHTVTGGDPYHTVTGGDPHHTVNDGDPHYVGGGAQYGGGGAPQYGGGGAPQYGGGGAPQYGGGVDPYYAGQGQPAQYGYDYYQKHCPCSKPHKKIDFVFVIKLVTKNYKPRDHRRNGFVSIHTDVLTVCQNDKKKEPYSGRGSSQPMARLETLKNVGAGCGPFDRMKEGECYIVRGYTTKRSRYRYFNIDQCYPPERVHCGYAKCPHY